MPRQVRCGRVMLGIERDQNLRVARANGAARTVRLIDAGIRQSDIVENRLKLPGRNLFTQRILDLVAKTRCFFDSQSSASPDVQAEKSSVHLREEILAKKRE